MILVMQRHNTECAPLGDLSGCLAGESIVERCSDGAMQASCEARLQGMVTITLRVSEKLANEIREYAERHDITTNTAISEMIQAVLRVTGQQGKGE